jgi:hypothetical protein
MAYANIYTLNWNLSTDPEELLGLKDSRTFIKIRNTSNVNLYVRVMGENDTEPADSPEVIDNYEYKLLPGEEVIDYGTGSLLRYFAVVESGTATPIVRQGY